MTLIKPPFGTRNEPHDGGVSPMGTGPGRCEHGGVALAVRRPGQLRFPRSADDRVLLGVAGGLARRLTPFTTPFTG